MEFDEENISLVETLKEHPLVTEVTVDKSKISIKTKDIDGLRKYMNEYIYNHQLLVKKIMIKEVSLEDIFMKVVNHHA